MNQIQYQSGAIDAGGCVSKAWELVQRNFGLYLGAGLVTILFISCIPLVNFFLLGPMMGGFAYLVLKDLRDEPIEFGMIFKGFEKFVPLMVLGLIQSVPAIVFQIFQYTIDIASVVGVVPPPAAGTDFFQGSDSGIGPFQAAGFSALIIIFVAYFVFQILWNAALTFAIPLVVERDASIGEAITLSFGAVFSNLGGLILLVILNTLVGILGLLALCIGIFVALPVTFAAYVIAYRQVFPDVGGPNLYTAPPPPDHYAGSFGQGQ